MIHPDSITKCGCGDCDCCRDDEREDGEPAYRTFDAFRLNMARLNSDTFADRVGMVRGTRATLDLFTELKAAARLLDRMDERLAGLLTQEPERVVRPGPVYPMVEA